MLSRGEGVARGVEVVFHFERRQAIFADRTGAIAPFAIAFATTQRIVLAHTDLPGLRWALGAPKKMPRSGFGETRLKRHVLRLFMSPANRAGIGTCDQLKTAGPVVVASSGPNPSATLHEERSASTARISNGNFPRESTSRVKSGAESDPERRPRNARRPGDDFDFLIFRGVWDPSPRVFCVSVHSKGR